MMMSKEQEDIKLYQVTELTWRQVTCTWEKRMDEEIDFFFLIKQQRFCLNWGLKEIAQMKKEIGSMSKTDMILAFYKQGKISEIYAS